MSNVKSKAQNVARAERKRRVASLWLRGLTIEEIVKAIADSGLFNPDTSKPWSMGAIWEDRKALEKEWREEYTEDINKLKQRHLAKLDELERTAWAKQDYNLVLKTIDRKVAILGLDAPQKIEHSGPGGDPVWLKLEAMTDEELSAVKDTGRITRPRKKTA